MRDVIMFASGYGLARLLDNHAGDAAGPLGSAVLGLILLAIAGTWLVRRYQQHGAELEE